MFHSLPDCLAQQAASHGDRPFLLFPERNQTVSYQQQWHRCRQAAHLLQETGVTAGQTVALLLPNIPEFVDFYWGAMTLGAVAGPINTLLSAPEIAYITEHAEAQVFVTTPEFADRIPPGVSVICVPDGECDSVIPGARVYTPEQQPALDTLPTVDGSQAAMIIYTSGTTGKPKGVLLSHHNLLVNGASIRDWFGLTPNSRWMNVLPLFHVNGEIVTLMSPLVSGASVVLNRKFSASQFWPTVSAYGVTSVSVVPTILSILVQNGRPTQAYPTLDFVLCGAAPLPVEVHKQFEDTFNVLLVEGYGLSETTCYATFNPKSPERKIGTIGLAVDCQVAIWNENNQPVPCGTDGEIVVKGNNVMLGYFKNPEATEKAFAGGWFHSGDWGRQDEAGYFQILDRVKDMIIRGGENIYPREVDEVLYQHPAVEAAATIGVPHPVYGEEVKSYVVAQSPVTEAALIAHCQQFLAAFKCPKSIAFVPEIPKGPTGKLLRRALRELG
jgi:acyl-CoA synthetase (AMP-forming)/AMP-acid ligase II